MKLLEGQAIAWTKREKVLVVMAEDLAQKDGKELKNEEEIRLELERKILQRNKMRLKRTIEMVRDTPEKSMGVFILLGEEKDLLVVALRVNERSDLVGTIDTGAMVSAITFSLVEMFNIQVKETNLTVRMLTGLTSHPLGTVFLEVETASGTKARGEAYVMELPELPHLLVGDDFLQQLCKVSIDYIGARPVKRAYPKEREKDTLVKMNADIEQIIRASNFFCKEKVIIREARNGDHSKPRSCRS